LPACPCLFAQSNAAADSIQIVRDELRNPQFVFPYDIAVEYRNLKADLYPLACARIETLTQLVASKDALAQNLGQQNKNLEQVAANQKTSIDALSKTLGNCETQVERLDRKARFYKTLSLISMPLLAVAVGVAVLK
jgi:uncharacterized coiled-coil protein SlyX